MRDYWNEQKATPPWELEGPKSLRQKVHNAWEYGQNQPGNRHPGAEFNKFELPPQGAGSGFFDLPPEEPLPPEKKLFQTSAEFVAGFVPPDYLIDGLMQRRYVYSFTAKTGDGKTAIALLLAACVARGTTLAGREVEKGRVLFFAGENPDDVRARWIKLCEALGEDPDHDGRGVHAVHARPLGGGHPRADRRRGSQGRTVLAADRGHVREPTIPATTRTTTWSSATTPACCAPSSTFPAGRPSW